MDASSVFGSGMTSITEFDFDLVSTIQNSNAFDPDASCKCPSVIPRAPKSYPPIYDPGQLFSCPSKADLTFSKDIVTYPVSQTLTTAGLDSFVQDAFQTINPPASCADKYKRYLCQFYFPECNTDNRELEYPAITPDAFCPPGLSVLLPS